MKLSLLGCFLFFFHSCDQEEIDCKDKPFNDECRNTRIVETDTEITVVNHNLSISFEKSDYKNSWNPVVNEIDSANVSLCDGDIISPVYEYYFLSSEGEKIAFDDDPPVIRMRLDANFGVADRSKSIVSVIDADGVKYFVTGETASTIGDVTEAKPDFNFNFNEASATLAIQENFDEETLEENCEEYVVQSEGNDDSEE